MRITKQKTLLANKTVQLILSACACAVLLSACSSTTPKPSKVHVKASKVTGNGGAEYSLSRVLITPENIVRITVVDNATTKTEVGAVSRSRYEATTGNLFVKSCKQIKLKPTSEGVPENQLARFNITQNIPAWVFVRKCV